MNNIKPPETDNSIIFVDAYAQIYRAYYAMPNLSNSKNFPTNAIFAVAKLLLMLDKEYPSRMGAFVFDKGEPEERIKILQSYKANRPPMPDSMQIQLPVVREFISAFGWPILEFEGMEADDLIAALSLHFKAHPVKIVSSDKDIAQLVDDRIVMLVPNPRGKGFIVRKKKDVEEKFGVSPSQIPDLLALTGDASDNIPGVPGIGIKTAAKLLKEWNSLSELVDHIDEIRNPKLREKLRESIGILKTNMQLIKLEVRLPDENLRDYSSILRNPPDIDKLKRLSKEYELKSILSDLEKLTETTQEEKQKSLSKSHSQSVSSTTDFYTPDLF